MRKVRTCPFTGTIPQVILEEQPVYFEGSRWSAKIQSKVVDTYASITVEVTAHADTAAVAEALAIQKWNLRVVQLIRATESRFYVDHGLIHDLDTGRHLSLDEERIKDKSDDSTIVTLNQMVSDEDALRHDLEDYVHIANTEATERAKIEEDRDYLRQLVSHMYQAAGAYSMPKRVMDTLSAASCGEPFAHMLDGLLPMDSPKELEVRSALYKKFLAQGFWHAAHVNLMWRHNGQYVVEEADWLKDFWYAEHRGHTVSAL